MKAFSNMEGVFTSLSLPPGSRLGHGIMVRINGEDYIVSFGSLKPHEFQQLQNLKVNDSINIKSHFISYGPKYAYSIVRGDYIEFNNKILFERPIIKEGC